MENAWMPGDGAGWRAQGVAYYVLVIRSIGAIISIRYPTPTQEYI